VPIEVSETPNQNSQYDRAKNNQKERNVRYLEELIISKRGEAKPNDNLLRVLQEEKNADDQDHSQKEILDPSHLLILPSGFSLFEKDP
jgi:cytochrome P450